MNGTWNVPGRSRRLSLAACVLAAAACLQGGQTRTWSESSYTDFEKGIVKNLSVRSDGLLSLAPRAQQLFDTPSAYLWALAEDSAGNLYAGGGTDAKVYRIPPKGKGKLFAELDGLQVQALAIDAKDRVYAATSPDGKVYRLSREGKPEVFYDPKAKYIWALCADPKGSLYVATGDPAQIHRVEPDGKGKVLYQSDETHIRSLTLDGAGDLIAGTEPGGLVIRISPAGEGFVLYQMSRREVTAVAVTRDGTVYAAAVGAKGAAAPAPLRTAIPAPGIPTPAPAAAIGAAGGAGGPRAVVPQAAPVPSAVVRGGSEVYAIDKNGTPRRIWSDSQDLVYAIAFDAEGRAVLGAGNHGNVYRVETPALYTALLTVPSTQITAFHQGRDGRLLAATGNTGSVYEIGPGLEKEGSIESDVFDAGMHSLWGRLTCDARLNGGQVTLATRSGNLDTPVSNWSPWSAPGGNGAASSKGVPVASPAARFVQWKARLTGGSEASRSPEIELVSLAYLTDNLEPRVDEIDLTPPNYKFPTPTPSPIAALLAPSQSLTLPPLGRTRTVPSAPSPSTEPTLTTTPSMQFAKGFLGARWVASDPNGDSLVYKVEIKGTNETRWKLLKDKVSEKYLSWDSTSFPDGEYTLRITASDSPSNPPGQVLSAVLESDTFIIDNAPPAITGLAATRNGGKLIVKWHAADALNDLKQAEYSLDGGDWTVAPPVTRLSDGPELDYELTVDAPQGEHTIAVRVADEYDNTGTAKTIVRE